MRQIERLLRPVDMAIAWAVGLMLVIITLVLFANAVARYFASFTIIGGDELARCLMIWMTFLGSYLLVRTRSHVAIDLLAGALKGRALMILNTIVALVGLVVCAYVTTLGYELTERVLATGQRMSSLPFGRFWFYLPVPIGFGMMTLAFLQILLAARSGIRLPELADFGPPAPVSPGAVAMDKDA